MSRAGLDRKNLIFVLALLTALGLVWETPAAADPPPSPEGYGPAQCRTFTADNLEEYINGQAGQYIRFGFRELESCRYQGQGGTLTVDLYRMDSSWGAYGAYLELGAGLRDGLGAGGPSSGDDYAAALVRGNFYVMASADRPGPDTAVRLAGLALAAARDLPDAPAPPELGLLPEEGLNHQSVRLAVDGLARINALPRGVSAQYQVDGRRVDLGLAVFKSEAEARAALEAAAAELADQAQGGREEQDPGLPPGWRLFSRKLRVLTLVGRQGNYVFIAARLRQAGPGLTLLRSLEQRLSPP